MADASPDQNKMVLPPQVKQQWFGQYSSQMHNGNKIPESADVRLASVRGGAAV
jgi:hypothetical protein